MPSTFTVHVLGRVLLILQDGDTDRAKLWASVDDAKRLHAQGPFAVLVCLGRGTGLPDSDSRAAIVGVMQEMGTMAAGVAVALEGDGFWAAAMRGAATAMSSAMGRPLRIFPTPQSGLDHLAHSLLSGVPSASALAAALQEHRASTSQ